MRGDAVRAISAVTEPPQICLKLKQLRVTLQKRYEEIDKLPICPESVAMFNATVGRYHETIDRILRLSRVPQAPSGAQSALPNERPQLDITPEAIPQEAPEASPSPDPPQGGLERDEPI